MRNFYKLSFLFSLTFSLFFSQNELSAQPVEPNHFTGSIGGGLIINGTPPQIYPIVIEAQLSLNFNLEYYYGESVEFTENPFYLGYNLYSIGAGDSYPDPSICDEGTLSSATILPQIQITTAALDSFNQEEHAVSYTTVYDFSMDITNWTNCYPDFWGPENDGDLILVEFILFEYNQEEGFVPHSLTNLFVDSQGNSVDNLDSDEIDFCDHLRYVLRLEHFCTSSVTEEDPPRPPGLGGNDDGRPVRPYAANEFEQATTDGSFYQSPSEEIKNFSTSFDNLIAFPNPATHFTNLKFDVKTDSYLTVELLDIYGRKLDINLNRSSFNTGEQLVELNLENYPNGVYFARVVNEKTGESHKTKILKIN